MSDNVIRSMFGMGKVPLMPNINGLLHVVAVVLIHQNTALYSTACCFLLSHFCIA